jgi:hypothetical protein
LNRKNIGDHSGLYTMRPNLIKMMQQGGKNT